MEISVVLPVYNGEQYIDACLPGILSQTFEDFELLLLDDGSTDGSLDKISAYRDPRIRVIRRDHDFIGTLNCGLDLAQGKYIARMDVDDTMEPHRLERQYQLMESEPEVAVCGSWCRFFGQVNRDIPTFRGVISHPLVHLLRGCIVSHPTVMMRKDFLQKNDLRYEHYPYAEDYKLWFEVAKKGGIFYMIPEILVNYRISPVQISQQKSEEQKVTAVQIGTEILEYLVSHVDIEKEKVRQLYRLTDELNEGELLSEDVCFNLFFDLFFNMCYRRVTETAFRSEK